MYKWPLIVMTVMSLVLSACTSAPISSGKPEPVVGVLADDYTIGVGDQLNVMVWRNPELSMSVPVRPDGKISVPLVGDILAAGISSEVLASQISTQLAEFIRNPQVTVIVTNPASSDYLQRVRLMGAVASPQSIPYRQGMMVLDVVLQAGGVTPFSRPNGALLYRQTEEGLKVYPVYLKDILEKGDLSTNYLLAPSDILTVPERIF